MRDFGVNTGTAEKSGGVIQHITVIPGMRKGDDLRWGCRDTGLFCLKYPGFIDGEFLGVGAAGEQHGQEK
ncbi:hypothetical protein D9M68_986160 [compost metagenome]